MKEFIAILVVLFILFLIWKPAKASIGAKQWTCTSDKGDKLTFNTDKFASDPVSLTAGGNTQGYDQVQHAEYMTPEGEAVAERMRSNMTNDVWDPDSRDQIAAYHEVTPPAWSDDALMYYGAVDAQTIQNHKAFISENWMFNQNAAFADFGDNPNYPYPVTSIRLNAINNVPTDSNPHQITEDQDSGGAARNTYTNKQICYGLVQ
jgi:hypothetical protein